MKKYIKAGITVHILMMVAVAVIASGEGLLPEPDKDAWEDSDTIYYVACIPVAGPLLAVLESYDYIDWF